MSEYHTQANLEAWADRHLKVKRRKAGEWLAHCPLPGHDDIKPSFSFNVVDGVFKCHSCNEAGHVGRLAELLGVDPPPRIGRSAGGQETVYPYRDANGRVVFEAVRRHGSGAKTLYRHTSPSTGEVVWKKPEAGHGLPYRLPELLAAIKADPGTTVCIAEGEKDCDSLARLGFTATTNAGGAGKWRVAHARAVPVGAKIVVFVDADNPGVKHGQELIGQLLKVGHKGICVVDPSMMDFDVVPRGGKDVTDWLQADASRDREALQGLIDRAIPEGLWESSMADAGRAEAPAPPVEDDDRPVVVVEIGRRLEWTRQAIDGLIAAGKRDDLGSLYQSMIQGGGPNTMLTHIIQAPPPSPDDSLQIPEGTLLMSGAEGVSPNRLLAHVDSGIKWTRRLKTGDVVRADPSESDARHIHARYERDSTTDHPRLRPLAGIADCPTLRRDGTLLSQRGYDGQSYLYINADDGWSEILPDKPSLVEAREALRTLYDLVGETRFKHDFDKAVWVAFLLTAVARGYAAGNVPFFGFTANTPGAGKGTLVDLACIVATSQPAAKYAPVTARDPRDAEAEDRKRLFAVNLQGLRVLCIDNVRPGSSIGSPALELTVTTGGDYNLGPYSDRILGTNTTAEALWRTIVCGTGNNLTIWGDMGRRTAFCSLDTDVDPAQLSYREKAPLDRARRDRRKLLGAALTILVAHKQAVDAIGEQEAREAKLLLPSIPSFGGWSDRIRSAVAWADPDHWDPWQGNRVALDRANPEQESAQVFFRAWHDRFADKSVYVSDVAEACRPEEGSPTMFHDDGESRFAGELRDAADSLGLVDHRGIRTKSLGRWLSGHKDRPAAYVLRQDDSVSSGRGKKWYVEEAAEQPPQEKPKTTPKETIEHEVRKGDFDEPKDYVAAAKDATYQLLSFDLTKGHPLEDVRLGHILWPAEIGGEDHHHMPGFRKWFVIQDQPRQAQALKEIFDRWGWRLLANGKDVGGFSQMSIKYVDGDKEIIASYFQQNENPEAIRKRKLDSLLAVAEGPWPIK